MQTVASIVEGDGEVSALPVLLRRLGEWLTPDVYTEIATPIRVRREQFLNKDDVFSRHLKLAAAKCGETGWVLILLDADDDCPATRGPEILDRARRVVPHRSVSVVLANHEYEAWFLAAAQSLDGQRGFRFDPADGVDPEVPRNAKGWIGHRMVGGVYREITDQPALTARMDLDQARARSRSFRKLCSEWSRQLGQPPEHVAGP
ncbi:hypothetical protein THSYN_07535 [Candidatus Thiodictyon syntrophicum]|uniref:DUF4276 family protein n=2 Tax=Candidatus Thiodictyon syntrophicum TaxID=1166950 RepID=A0A2K8UGN0_9GAMM|nr:hypothetical protein THSYN_07535 [Candidatus Thiodictyon syntrophicum]